MPPRSPGLAGRQSFDRADGETVDAEDFEGDPTSISELANTAALPQPPPMMIAPIAPIPPAITGVGTGPGQGHAPEGKDRLRRGNGKCSPGNR